MSEAASANAPKEDSSIWDIINKLKNAKEVIHPDPKDLAPLHTRLTSPHPSSPDARHWFCSQATPIIRECATYLVVLFTYDATNKRVASYLARLKEILFTCISCSEGFQDAKLTSRTSYFKLFQPERVDMMLDMARKWECKTTSEMILGSPNPAVPTITLHQILVDASYTSDPLFAGFILTRIVYQQDPSPSHAPGLLMLLFHSNQPVRDWAYQSFDSSNYSKCLTATKASHIDAIQRILGHIPFLCAPKPEESSNDWKFFTKNAVEFWSAMTRLIEKLPMEVLCNDAAWKNIVMSVITHLNDTGPHFGAIFRCFVLLLKKVPKILREKEAFAPINVANPSSTSRIFDAIKDNPEFLHRFEETPDKMYFSWLLPYLTSAPDGMGEDSQVMFFRDVLAKMAALCFEELQHPRFEHTSSPLALEVMVEILQSVLDKEKGESKGSPKVTASKDAVERHSELLLSIAFSSEYKAKAEWNGARKATRRLIKGVLDSDAAFMASGIATFGVTILEFDRKKKELERAIDTKKGTDKEKARAEPRTAEKLKIELDALPMATWQKVARFTSIRPRLWSQLYSALLIPDADSFQLVLNVIGRISGFAELWQKAYIRGTGDLHKNLERTRRAINVALSTVQSGFGNLCTRFCNSSVPVVLEQFMEQHHTVEDLILCIFSPVQDFQDGSMQILGQVFQDAALRSECLRAIMKAHPERSRRALVHLLTGFNRRVEELPDACESAKTLVRALTDVMVALCSQDVSQERGLLYDDELRSRLTGRGADSDIGTMWKLMTQAISSIFAKAPVWSAYYDDSALKLWLRDALIFARELANERRLFQAAVSQKEGAAKSNTSIILLSPSKMKRRARDMVKDLLIVFSGALRWLRITDLELLHQSFSLIESLFEIFKESGIVISEDYIKQLNGVIDHAKRSPTLEPQRQSRLNNSQVQRLVAMVEESKDDGDEIIEIQASDFKRPEKAPVAIAKKPEILPVPKKEPAKTQGGSIAPKPIIGLQPFSGAKPGLPKTPAGRFAGPKAGSRASSSVAEDSDSDSSDSSDDSDKGVSVLATKQKSPEKVVQRHRGIQLLPGFGTQVGTAQNRIDRQSDAQRTLKRLKPDLTGLHKMILGWNYDANGDLPPGFDGSTLKEVPKQFGSVEQYTAVLGPLLMLEIWSQLMKSKDDDQELVNCIIGPKAFVDSWTELELQIPQTFDSKWFVTDTDICVLRNPTTKTKILCKVENSKKTALRYVVNIRFLGKGSPNNGEQWLFSKVFSLSTVHREYGALQSLQYFDMCGDIVSGKVSKTSTAGPQAIKRAMETYRVNEPQAVAILGALGASGFVLIQGPPGTGKTWTICGMVGEFLSNRAPQATAIQVGRSAGNAPKATKKKILLCAPSNAAIDEVAKRICAGIFVGGKKVVPSVVRVGAENSINISAREISLEALVQKKLDQELPGAPDDTNSPLAKMRSELAKTKTDMNQKRQELATSQGNSARVAELGNQLSEMAQTAARLSRELNTVRDKQNDNRKVMDAARRRIRAEILSDADVVCSTLSGSGHEMISEYDFDTVIIDEAAQAVELSSLIPLKYSAKRCILVGDPKQLPPTVISPIATKFDYNRSLFARMEMLRPEAIHLLSVQYRMHPDISTLPSAVFYQGRLQDGPNMALATKQVWHANPDFGPYRFFDVAGNEEVPMAGYSFVNRTECAVAVALFNRLRTAYPQLDFDRRVGVVSMYRAQVSELKRQFEARFGRQVLEQVDFQTVDGFQGQEKDIIILSCVRGGPRVESVGFLADERRMNVAITRSRSSLFILGNAPTLERSNQTWQMIVQDARARKFLIKATKAYFERPMTVPAALPSSPTRPTSVVAKPPPPPLKKKASSATSAPAVSIPKDLVAVGRVKPSPSTPNAEENTKLTQVIPPPRPLKNFPEPLSIPQSSVPNQVLASPAYATSGLTPSNPSSSKPKAPIPITVPRSSSPATGIPPRPEPTAPIVVRKPQVSAFIPKKRKPLPGGTNPPPKRHQPNPPGL